MKIVLFSDIHANLPALQAFFSELQGREYDSIFCLGDLVGYNVWPNEVVDEIRRRRIPTITGNYDFGIGRSIEDCGCAYKTEKEKVNGAISISYTNRIVKDEQRQYLRTLPQHIRIEFQLNDRKLNLLLVHGSPRTVNEYLFEDRDEKSLRRILSDAHADILCFGHTHKPYHRVLNNHVDRNNLHQHAINVGSVGKPKDGDNRGCYVIIHFNENSSLDSPDSIQVEIARFEYDIEAAAKAIEESELPNDYAESLRRGI